MAMTTRRQPNHNQPPAADPLTADRPLKGFGYLTLDPGPRLRRARERVEEREPVVEAWRIVGQAIREAVRTIAVTVKSIR